MNEDYRSCAAEALAAISELQSSDPEILRIQVIAKRALDYRAHELGESIAFDNLGRTMGYAADVIGQYYDALDRSDMPDDLTRDLMLAFQASILKRMGA